MHLIFHEERLGLVVEHQDFKLKGFKPYWHRIVFLSKTQLTLQSTEVMALHCSIDMTGNVDLDHKTKIIIVLNVTCNWHCRLSTFFFLSLSHNCYK